MARISFFGGGGASVVMSNLSAIWNNVSEVFTAIKMNVTDTASAATSLLMDLQVGGVSKFRVNKDGSVAVPEGTAAAPGVSLTNDADSGLRWSGANMVFVASGTDRSGFTIRDGIVGVTVPSSGGIGFSGSSSPLASMDTVLRRDGGGQLALRNGVTEQDWRVYGTFTDTSNYERLRFSVAAGVVMESAGTGAANIDLPLVPAGTGRVKFGAHAAIGAETVTGYVEIRDAGGTVRKLAVVS